MTVKEILVAAPQRGVFEGALNVNDLLPGPLMHGAHVPVLHRFPKRNTAILDSLAYEYHGIGFTQLGGRFRRRSPDEQEQFAKRCAELGLNVLPPLSHEHGYIETIFLEHAEKLDDFLIHATDEQAARCTYEIYTDLFKAHSAGIVYGDRWAENILVVPKLGVINVDFDIEISGAYAREFEAAQIATYILGGVKEKGIVQLAKLLTLPTMHYDVRYLALFLRGHSNYYDADHKYGSIENEINVLEALLHRERATNR